MLRDPKKIYLPEWWWSPVPFYKYINAEGFGWGTLVDTHPGMFNLAWAMCGQRLPVPDYQPYGPKIMWVLGESGYIPLAGKTLADWAFCLTLRDFAALLGAGSREMKRWKFYDADMSYGLLLATVRAACKQGAKS